MNFAIRSLRALLVLARRLATAPRLTRGDLELLDRWTDNAVDEGATHTLESRLFFDPTLLRAARQAQCEQQRERRAGRLLATLLVGVVACSACGELRAEVGDSYTPTKPAAGDEGSAWDWLEGMITITPDDKGAGGSNDPETGED